jgi:hypothetical protein
VLTSIPVISPIEVRITDPDIRRLPPPDYEIQPLLEDPGVSSAEAQPETVPAVVALDEIERAARVSEYHDFEWWDERIRLIRARLEQREI